MSKPIERKYDINKKNKKNKSNSIVTKVPHNPVMLSKDELFQKIKHLIILKK